MSSTPLGISALHDIHQDLHAVFVAKDGWKKPARYGLAVQEADYLKFGVGVTDVSFDRKLIMQGSGIDSFLSKKLPNITSLRSNSCGIDDRTEKCWAIYARLSFDELFVVADYSKSEELHFAEDVHQDIHVLDMTAGFAGIALTGPSAGGVLSGIAQLDFSDDVFLSGACAQIGIAGVYGLVIRSDLGLIPSYRIYVNREYGRYVWESIFGSATEYDPRPVGLEAFGM